MARTVKTSATHPVTTGLVASIIDPIVAWCDAEHGRRQEFVEEVRKVVAPENVTRQMVESWINTDPEKRAEPMLGNGLAMMNAAHRLGLEVNLQSIVKNPIPKK